MGYRNDILIGSFSFDEINLWLDFVNGATPLWKPVGHTILHFSKDDIKEYKSLGMIGKGSVENLESLYGPGFYLINVQCRSTSYEKIDHIDKIKSAEENIPDFSIDRQNYKFTIDPEHWITNKSFTVNNCMLDNSAKINRVGDIISLDFDSNTIVSSIIDATTFEVGS